MTIITEQDIEQALTNGTTKDIIMHVENVIVQKAIVKHHGNISAVARAIPMSRGKVRDVLNRVGGLR